jgi:hypothetical protein
MAHKFGKRPSEFWGFLDPGIAFDFDRLHYRRLQYHENAIARAQADAIKGESEPSLPDRRIFESGEGIKFS